MLSATVVLMLALGLGANGAIFSVIDAIVLRPFPIEDLDRMVMLAESSPNSLFDFETFSVAPANYLDWREQAEVFETLAAYEYWDVNLEGRDEPERVQGIFVSPGFLEILGVEPSLGRTFLPEEEEVGKQDRVILGHGLWTRRFGSDPSVLGQSIMLDGEAYTVVGVGPEGFDFPVGAEVWSPLAFPADVRENRSARYLTVVGRLKDDRTVEDAAAQMQVVANRLKEQYPNANGAWDVGVRPLAEGLVDPGAPAFLAVMQFGAGLVLLIACANIANLLLARGTERNRELALRMAIGAGRRRLFQLLIAEALLLSIAGAALSIMFAWIGLDLIRSHMPANIARFVNGWREIDVDLRLIAFTVGGALLTAGLFGSLPALRFSRPDLNESLKQGGRGTTDAQGRLYGRNALVVAQIAMALSLLVGAGITVSAMQRMVAGPHGFDPDRMLTVRLSLPATTYEELESQRRFAQRTLEEVSALPGVLDVAISNALPGTGTGASRRVFIEGDVLRDETNPYQAGYRTVSADYFETLDIPSLSGRGFLETDDEEAPLVTILSQSMARRHWPDENAIGKRLKVDTPDQEWLNVVGVSGDVVHHWIGSHNAPTVYLPYLQAPRRGIAIGLRTADAPTLHAQALREAVLRVDPSQPVYEVRTMARAIRDTTLGIQYAGGIMTVLGGLALLLSSMGIYGLMAYLVNQRVHEIGIRTALGASSRNVLGLMLGRVARLTAAGMVVGVGLALALGRLMENALFGTVGLETGPFLAFTGLLAGISMVAGYIPTRKALKVDPIQVLRND